MNDLIVFLEVFHISLDEVNESTQITIKMAM